MMRGAARSEGWLPAEEGLRLHYQLCGSGSQAVVVPLAVYLAGPLGPVGQGHEGLAQHRFGEQAEAVVGDVAPRLLAVTLAVAATAPSTFSAWRLTDTFDAVGLTKAIPSNPPALSPSPRTKASANGYADNGITVEPPWELRMRACPAITG